MSCNKTTLKTSSKWDDYLNCIVKEIFNMTRIYEKHFSLTFENEVSTINNLFSNTNISSTLKLWFDSLEDDKIIQSDTDSESYRNKGNAVYKRGEDFQQLAILYYTYAILLAPQNSIQKAYAHANRSLPLIELNMHDEAFNDCEMAIQLDYPKTKIAKLIKRQLRCIENSKNNYNSRNNLSDINDRLDQENKIKIEEFRKKLNNRQHTSNENILSTDIKEDILVENYSIEKGRFMITNKEITDSHSFLIEEAFAFIPVIDSGKIDCTCQNCAKVNIVPFPCPNCCMASYCSLNCMKSHENIHQLECKGYKIDLWNSIGIAHLSIRTFLIGIYSLIEELLQLKQAHFKNAFELFDKCLEISESNRDFRYGRVLRLVTNYESMDKTDLLKYSLTAVMLTIYLKKYTNFFNTLMQEGNDLLPSQLDWEILTASLIMRHCGQLISNGHGMTDLQNTLHLPNMCEKFRGNKPIVGYLQDFFVISRVFTGIFPNVSLFNHSCDPNIYGRFNQNKLTIFASRKIQKNSEILNCYGPQYKLLSKIDRQNVLENQYSFKCNCERCKITNDEEYLKFRYYKCQNKQCKEKVLYESDKNWWELSTNLPEIMCRNCSKTIDLTWYNGFDNLAAVPSNLSKAITTYKKCKLHLSPDHDLKQIITEKLLFHFTPCAVQLNEANKLIPIANDLIEMNKNKYGHKSLEYILSSTYLIDILAWLKRDNIAVEYKYDLSEIKSSFEILSDQARLIFDEYINKFL